MQQFEFIVPNTIPLLPWLLALLSSPKVDTNKINFQLEALKYACTQ